MIHNGKKKWRCTKGINTLLVRMANREGHYVWAHTREEALAQMRARYPHCPYFTAHEWYAWLEMITAL